MSTTAITDTAVQEIEAILANQCQFFASGATLSQAFREQQLLTLKKAIKAYQSRIETALYADLRKSKMESYVSEIALVYDEIEYMLKHLGEFIQPQSVKTPASHFPATSQVIYEPYGMVLNIAPWNYPFQLCLAPIVGAIAAGNTVVLKPSEHAVQTSRTIKAMIDEYFQPEYFAVIEGGVTTNEILLTHKFDYIFFTGSTKVGKIVMKAASEFLTPVTLELGGKSPCIVDKTADIAQAAKRIMWGKTLNSGQTCIAPDYLWVHEAVKEPLVNELKRAVQGLFGADPLQSPDYPKIINQHHYERVKAYLSDGQVLIGGEYNDQTQQISPTVLDGVTWDSPVMQEEIFGTVLPLLTYRDIDPVINAIKQRDKPLALYLFSKDNPIIEKVLSQLSFGGGCINDTLMHIANQHLPFGGVGVSGMGAYHGKSSFYTFSHAKSVLKRGTWVDVPVRYPPYNASKLAVIKTLV